MVGENFEFYLSQIARNGFKLSTMFVEKFEFYLSQIARNVCIRQSTHPCISTHRTGVYGKKEEMEKKHRKVLLPPKKKPLERFYYPPMNVWKVFVPPENYQPDLKMTTP